MSERQATPLGERDLAVLEFEREWWRHAGTKESAVRERFEVSLPDYYRLLNALIDRPEAFDADRMLVKRLRRQRRSRQRRRSVERRRLG